MNNKYHKEINRYFLGFILLLIFMPLTLNAQKNIPVSGKVIDNTGKGRPSSFD